MSKTVDLPYYDYTGKLTPLIVEAMKNGATSDHHATDPDKITLTFAKAADADAFAKAVAPILNPAPATDPTSAAIAAAEAARSADAAITNDYLRQINDNLTKEAPSDE